MNNKDFVKQQSKITMWMMILCIGLMGLQTYIGIKEILSGEILKSIFNFGIALLMAGNGFLMLISHKNFMKSEKELKEFINDLEKFEKGLDQGEDHK